MKKYSIIIFALLVLFAVHSCKQPYQYDKYGMQLMTGTHRWKSVFTDHYHNGSYTKDTSWSMPDTSFIVGIIDKEIVQVGDTRLYLTNEYATVPPVIFVNDTGTYCGYGCHKIFLYYDYNSKGITVDDGIYNTNGVDDTVHTYTTVLP